MKKLLLLPLLLITLLLTGCNSKPDYTYVDAAHDKATYNTWIKEVEFDTTMISIEGQNYTKAQTRFEIFLPKNIVEASRYAVTSIEEIYSTKYRDLNIVANSFTNSQQYGAYFLNMVNSKSKDITAALNAETTNDDVKYEGLALPENFAISWTHTFTKNQLQEFASKEGSNRSIVTVYLPVKYEYYLEEKGKDAHKVLTSYLVLPIKSELVYTTTENNEEKLAKDSIYNKFDQVTLTVKDGLLA